jgi:peptidyl-dipeptidase Dcp
MNIISQIKPAFDVAIKERLMEIEAIANNPKALTLKNTIASNGTRWYGF